MSKVTSIPVWQHNVANFSLTAISYHWHLSSHEGIRVNLERHASLLIKGYDDINRLVHDGETIRRSNSVLFYRLTGAFHNQMFALHRIGQQIPYESLTALRIMLPFLNDVDALSLTRRMF